MKKIFARAALLPLAFLLATAAYSQSASPLPEACATVLGSIVSDHVAADQLAGLRNTGAILCFSELAPKQLAASTLKSRAPAKLVPASLTATPVHSPNSSQASLSLPGAKLNKAQEKINRDLHHLQLSGADYESWQSCIRKEFSAEQLSDSSRRASKFSTYWTQLAGIIFASESANCQPDAPVVSEERIHGLWPTKAQRNALKSKYQGLLSDAKTKENRLYWGLKLLDSIDEYRIALKLFDEASLRAGTTRRSSTARLLPVRLPQPAACKIAGLDPTAPSSAMPVTINLCKDNQANPSANMQFASVDIYDDKSGNHISGQPTTLKPNSFVLKLPKGVYDINSTVAPASGSGGSKPTVFLYESCSNPKLQLCAFITAVGPGSSFQLTVN